MISIAGCGGGDSSDRDAAIADAAQSDSAANDAAPPDSALGDGNSIPDSRSDGRPLPDARACGGTPIAPGGSRVVYVDSFGIGHIAIRMTLPLTSRYGDGAPVVVNVNTFFTPREGFSDEFDGSGIGAITLTHLWPGKSDAATGAASQGTYDHAGPKDIESLRDVLLFASGGMPDINGCYIGSLSQLNVLTSNVGIYAFSHPGVAAANVMASHGNELTHVSYFVGRENPTQDVLSAVEVGHFETIGGQTTPVYNSGAYVYPRDYQADGLHINYMNVGWSQTQGTDCTANGIDHVPTFPKGTDTYRMGCKVPTMYGKKYYSTQLIAVLAASGLIVPWPNDLPTPQQAWEAWSYRSTDAAKYALIGQKMPSLKVMLVFSSQDHIQVALDKPHIHQAYDGFRAANLWTRLNPDRVYSTWSMTNSNAPNTTMPDTEANLTFASLSDWANMSSYGIPNVMQSTRLVPLAAVAEMADRTHENNWSLNLTQLLVTTPAPMR